MRPVAYDAERFQARVAYYGSIFKNDDAALVWANPYLPLGTGATTGQLALAPSNEFHQLASGAFKIAERAAHRRHRPGTHDPG
jgi:hypothetical protein